MSRWIVVVVCLLAVVPCPAQRTGMSPAEIEALCARVMKTFEVPGVALSVVHDGKVVEARGFGVKRLGETDRVDPHTLFGIASNTKAFTATAIGLLVEEKKLGWDDHVIDHLPWFRLSDPYVTKELTVRDLLVHRSGLGLGAGDLLWWPPSTYNRKEIARRLKDIPLKTSFRSAYAYDNVLYLVAGELIEEVSGMTWEEFVQKRILDVVGMTTSNVRHSASEKGGNVATPHARVEGVVRVVKPFGSDNTNPAGGINTNAIDMATWLQVQLDSGRVSSGGRLFSPRTTRELWNLVTPIRPGTPPPELAPTRSEFNGYALGFQVRDHRGYKIITHTGGLPGYLSQVTLVPALRLGIGVLTNQESGAAFSSITLSILDKYIGAPAHDWVAAYKRVEIRNDSLQQAAVAQSAAKRDSLSHPSLPLNSYAGTYTDVWYGDVTVTIEKDGPVLRFTRTPALIGDLVHWQYDTFLVRWRDRELRADAFVSFTLNAEGRVEQARIVPASPEVDFSFDFQDLSLKRKAD